MYRNEEITTPLVTIGLLTYNNEKTLVRALEGLVHQTYENKELIIFDDVSTDGTYAILEKYAQQYPFIKLYRNECNVGVYKNLDQLLQKVEGGYFLWACPDDEYHVDFLKKSVDTFFGSPNTVSFLSSSKIIFEDGDKPQLHQEATYQKINFDFYTKNRRTVLDSVLLRKNLEQFCVYIHGITKTSFWKSLLPINPSYFSIEELFPMAFIFLGGINTASEILYIKHQSLTPLKHRNMEAHKIAYGLKNKILCLWMWMKFIIKSGLNFRQKAHFLLVLLVSLKKIIWDQIVFPCMKSMSSYKKRILKSLVS